MSCQSKANLQAELCSGEGQNERRGEETLRNLKAYNSRIMNLEIYKDESGAQCIDLPGIPYVCFNRLGLPSPWMIAMQLDLWRVKIEDIDMGKVIRIMIAQKFTFSNEFYENAAIKLPMVFRKQATFISDKSTKWIFGLRDAKSNTTYLTVERSFVFVDPNARKRVPIPDSVKAKIPQTSKPFRVEPAEIPVDSFTTEYQVCHSDTDMLFHANNSTLIKYAMDAAAEATHKGLFKLFQGDFFAYNVHQLEIAYRGECFSGEVVSVSVWEAQRLSQPKLYFEIKKRGKNVCFGNISFFMESSILGSKL